MTVDHREAALKIIRALTTKRSAYRYIARALDIAGIPTPSGQPGVAWSAMAVHRLVRANGLAG